MEEQKKRMADEDPEPKLVPKLIGRIRHDPETGKYRYEDLTQRN